MRNSILAFCVIFWSCAVQAQEPQSFQKVSVDVEIPILNGDVMAAREASQSQAFEKAVARVIPENFHSVTKEQRVKGAIRYIKSFRVEKERQIGETLHMTYEVEVQDSAMAPDPLAGPQTPTSPVQTPTVELGPQFFQIEIVTARRLNAPELVDQLKQQVKLNIKTFKMTRSALILQVEESRTKENLQGVVQGVIGDRGTVSVTEASPPPPKIEWVQPDPVPQPVSPSVPVP